MSSLVLAGDTSGSITVSAPAVAGTQTLTLPAATGTVMVSGNMPAFSVWQSTGQVISSGTLTKIQFQTKDFDTASAFDNTTNYRFQPLVAGYYQLNLSLNIPALARTTEVQLVLYKNGSVFKSGTDLVTTNLYILNMSNLVYLNGSTDYVEGWCYFATGATTVANQTNSWFQGSMVRAA